MARRQLTAKVADVQAARLLAGAIARAAGGAQQRAGLLRGEKLLVRSRGQGLVGHDRRRPARGDHSGPRPCPHSERGAANAHPQAQHCGPPLRWQIPAASRGRRRSPRFSEHQRTPRGSGSHRRGRHHPCSSPAAFRSYRHPNGPLGSQPQPHRVRRSPGGDRPQEVAPLALCWSGGGTEPPVPPAPPFTGQSSGTRALQVATSSSRSSSACSTSADY